MEGGGFAVPRHGDTCEDRLLLAPRDRSPSQLDQPLAALQPLLKRELLNEIIFVQAPPGEDFGPQLNSLRQCTARRRQIHRR